MSDPLSATIKRTLWPFLQAEGFTPMSSRKFAREKNHVFQQVWIDAGGVKGRRGVKVILCANLPYGPVEGYLDPHGFQLSNGRSWPMDTPERAATSMQQVVNALRAEALQSLDALADLPSMLDALNRNAAWRSWSTAYSALHQAWMQGDATTLALVEANRRSLKL